MAWTRKLPSGKYQAVYRDARGRERVEPQRSGDPALDLKEH